MTRRSKNFFLLFGFLFAFLFLAMCAPSVRAAEENAANAKQEHAANMFKWINFAIVAGILGYVFLKITPPTFRKRADDISSEITKMTAAKADADKQLKDAEGRLARLQQEVAQLRAAGEQDAKAESERMRSVTQSDAAKINAAAKAEIEAAERAARLELKAIAANLAVDGAESLLAKQLTPQTQEALVASFVQGLEERPN
jgi:F-type H+-transporting ATPase subunit b